MWVSKRRKRICRAGLEGSDLPGLGLLLGPQPGKILVWGWVFLLTGPQSSWGSEPTHAATSPWSKMPCGDSASVGRAAPRQTGHRCLCIPWQDSHPHCQPSILVMESSRGRRAHRHLSEVPCFLEYTIKKVAFRMKDDKSRKKKWSICGHRLTNDSGMLEVPTWSRTSGLLIHLRRAPAVSSSPNTQPAVM